MAKRGIHFLSLLLLLSIVSNGLQAQPTRISLSDNFVVPGDTALKIAAGNYNYQDTEEDGVVQIIGVSNVIIDFDSARLQGSVDSGYAIYMENASNIVIKNILRANDYFYAIYMKNCQNITIDSNFLWHNKSDSFGIITIFDSAAYAHGGGVFMDSCHDIQIRGNRMELGNDGVAAYNSSRLTIVDNLLSNNRSFGVRLLEVDSSTIARNEMSLVFRYTSASGAAGVLGIYSTHLMIDSNYGSFSERGIYLNDQSTIQIGFNTVTNNDFTSTLQAAIASLYTQGNKISSNFIEEAKIGINVSNSVDMVVDSNAIEFGRQAAIYSSHSVNSRIRYNTILSSLNGLHFNELFSPLPPYNWESRKHLVAFNLFENCPVGIRIENTDSTTIETNQFQYNEVSVVVDSNIISDTLIGNVFYRSADYHIMNHSGTQLEANNNSFSINDLNHVSEYIFDEDDSTGAGSVVWQTLSGGVPLTIDEIPNSDLFESPQVWRSYSKDGRLAYSILDSNIVHEGDEMLLQLMGSTNPVRLHYWPEGNDVVEWDLSDKYGLTFYLRSEYLDSSPSGSLKMRLRNHETGGYFEYTSDSSIYEIARSYYRLFFIPFAGDSIWQKDSVGDVSLSEINDLEFYIEVSDNKCQFRFDGMHILPEFNLSVGPSPIADNILFYPNPSTGRFNITFPQPDVPYESIEIYNTNGVLVELDFLKQKIGIVDHIIELKEHPAGIYIVKVNGPRDTITRKLSLIK